MSDRERIIGLIAARVWICLVFLQQAAAHANEALRWMEMYRLYQQQVVGVHDSFIQIITKKKKTSINHLLIDSDG